MDNKRSWIVLILAIIVVATAGYFIFGVPSADKKANAVGASMAAAPEIGDYQAVFLVNNQVYFGKLSNENAQFPVLKDIYYLQVNQPIQPAQTVKGAPVQAAVNPDINLVKLGGELHGPSDEMRINRDQILLIEDLRADSNLVKAIEKYKVGQSVPASAKSVK